MQTARDKALLCNTLLGIAKACEGKRVQIDLRNELHVFGKVEFVSTEMNITMSNAFLTLPIFRHHNSTSNNSSRTNERKLYKEITIRGCNVRYVHIPDEVDMIEALRDQIQAVKRGRVGVRPVKNKIKNKK